MHLTATVTASPYDDEYDMAYVYCYDEKQKYCFSLSRSPGQNEIEIMVLDQLNHKVEDLDVQLSGNILTVVIDKDVAAHLDRHTHYTIEITTSSEDDSQLRAALEKIFEGKHGLRLFP